MLLRQLAITYTIYMTEQKLITVETTISAPVAKVWECWNDPQHITQWAFASDDWEAPHAENDVRVGGTFVTTMAAKDGSARFDFNGVYTAVLPLERIEYTIEGGRKVAIEFRALAGKTKIIETFEMENENPAEMQRAGWQAILENFKKHVETTI